MDAAMTHSFCKPLKSLRELIREYPQQIDVSSRFPKSVEHRKQPRGIGIRAPLVRIENPEFSSKKAPDITTGALP